MKLLMMCPQWGQEHLPLEAFLDKVKEAGYDGIDTWLPADINHRKKLIRLLDQYRLLMVSHQHQASGANITEFCRSFDYYLNICLESEPLIINSHSGRDFFSLDDQLRVIDVAAEFTAKTNVQVAHETHRGRLGFSPYNALQLWDARPQMKITADLSHWVCVTESYLENCTTALEKAISSTRHIHARVGYPQGPQIPDPRLQAWMEPVDFFMKIWGRIIDQQKLMGSETLTITPEFGPPPYMWTDLKRNEPVADQLAINLYMKDLLLKNFDQN